MKKNGYKYLLSLYSQVDDFLADTQQNKELLPEVVVFFCIIVERILKINLYKKNPILVYDQSKFKVDDALITILKKKDLNIESIKIKSVLERYKLVFKNSFSDDDILVLISIFDLRNHLVHSYKADNDIFDDFENIVKKMGTVWEKISKIVIKIFGKQSIKSQKPQKKYSEEELEKVLEDEVRKKIENFNKYGGFGIGVGFHNNRIGYSLGNDKCPRCGNYGFSKEKNKDLFSSPFEVSLGFSLNDFSDIYKCDNCNLELTSKEFEIAKSIIRNY